MGRWLVREAVVICLLLTTGTFAQTGCQKGCSKIDNGNLKFIPGNVYEYNFESVMSLAVSTGTNNDDTTLKVSGSAKLFAEGNCGYTLQLGGVKIIAGKENIEKKISSNIQKPVHFTMSNDKIDPELCSDANDNLNSLNIKRAVISLIQTSMEGEHEVDVFGQCPTYTTLTNIGGATVVTKVRNLNKCGYRENFANPMFNGVVNDNAGIKSSGILNADFSKESKISNGVLEYVKSIEDYKYRGASKTSPGVSAKVVTILKLKNKGGVKSASPVPISGSNKVSIIFEKPSPQPFKNIVALKKLMEDVIQMTTDFVHKDSATGFIELIRLMRNSDDDTLLELSNVPFPNKVQARKVYLDALFRVRTAESAKAILKQISKMNDEEKRLAILSLNLVERVDKETLTILTDILTADAPKESFLSIGNLVSKYCNTNKCGGSKEIDLIAKKFSESLKNCKPNIRRDEDRFMSVLKGVGNSEQIAKKIVSNLLDCADVGRPNRIRVAALEVLSLVSCEKNVEKKTIELLKNRNEDSELRIEAYLTLISCPNAEMANTISEIVNSETVKQVGGFIKSNLKAIRDSTDPHKELQKHYLGNIRVTKKFAKDFQRFSFNNEISYKFDALGLSGSLDHKLIYSQHGFLPRSAHVNVTTELFGTNFNVLEGKIRQENLENLLEYIVGPKGLFNKNFEEIIKAIEGGNGVGEGERSKRSIADEANKVWKKYKDYGSKSFEDLNLDLSLKLFGSELVFLSLGDHIPASFQDLVEKLTNDLSSLKKKISSFNKEFAIHSLFLDTHLVYPTAGGIPFDVSVQGFSANKLEFGVNIDIDSILERNWQDMKFELKLVPSFDIVGSIKAGFNAMGLSTGLRVNSDLHSATGSKMKFNLLKDEQGFNMDLDLPRNKLELFDLGVDVGFYVSDSENPIKINEIKALKPKKGNDDTSICFNQLEFLGLNVCLRYENRFDDKNSNSYIETILSPCRYNLYMTSEPHINIRGLHTNNLEKGSQLWNLEYSTPHSENNHKTDLSLEIGVTPLTFGRISLNNDLFNFALEAGITNDGKELTLYGQYEQEKSIQKSKIGFLKNGNEYHPIIEINENQRVVDNINGYRMDGKIIVVNNDEKQTKYEFQNLRIYNDKNSPSPIIFNGWLIIGAIYFNSDMEVQMVGNSEYRIVSGLRVDNGQYELKMFINDKNKQDSTVGGSMNLGIKQNQITVDLKGKGLMWEIDTLTNMDYTKLDDATNRLSEISFKNNLIVKHKAKEVLKLLVDGSAEGYNKIKVLAEIHRGSKMALLNVEFNKNEKSEHDYIFKLNGKLNNQVIDVFSSLQFNGNHFLLDNSLQSSWGTLITLKGELGQRYSMQDIFIDIQGLLQLTNKDKAIQWLVKIIGAPDKTINELKISRDNADIVKFTADIIHPQDKITSLKGNLNVKNLLVTKVDFKITKNGKGELTSSIEMLKMEPKQKIDVTSKFHFQTPKYDLEAVINLDENRKIVFKTENVLDKAKMITKNTLETIEGKKIFLEANLLTKGEWKLNGEINGNFKFILPDGHTFDGVLKRKITTNQKTGIAQGSMELQLNDRISEDKRRSLEINGKIEKVHLKTKDFATTIQILFTNLDNEQMKIDTHLKHLPKGINKSIDFGLAVNCPKLNHPLQIQFTIDEYNPKNAKAHSSIEFGDFISNSDLEFHVGYPDASSSLKVQTSIKATQTKWQNFEINFEGKFLKELLENEEIYLIDMGFNEKFGANNDHFIEMKNLFKGSKAKGGMDIILQSSELNGPFKLLFNYEREKIDSSTNKNKYSLALNFADKFVKSSGEVSLDGSKCLLLNIDLDSSYESWKSINLLIDGKHSRNKEDSDLKIVVKNHEESSSVDLKTFRSSHKKGFDLNIVIPNSNPITITNVAEILGEKKGKLTFIINNLMGLDFDGQAEASYTAIDNFYIIAKCKSEKLHLNKYDFDVHTEKNSLQISLKNVDGLVFGGSMKISLKQDNNKSMIDGQGQLQYKGKTEKANFRLIRQSYILSNDQEMGFSYIFNGNLGTKNSVSTYKITNKEFNIKFSLCEEKKHCTNVQLQSIVERNQQDFSNIIHSVLILLDLRELGYPYEFEFQSKSVNHGLKYQYNLESSIVSNNNLKYQLLANVVPTSSTVQIKLPSREISLETITQAPQVGEIFGQYEGSFKFYIDKRNHPDNVLSFISKCDISGVKYSDIQVESLLKLEHPTVRPFIVNGKLDANWNKRLLTGALEFDVFKEEKQKLILKTDIQNINNANNEFKLSMMNSLSSNGLGINYKVNGYMGWDNSNKIFTTVVAIHHLDNTANSKFSLYGSKSKIEGTFIVMDEKILHLLSEIKKTQKNSYNVETNVELYNEKPIKIETSVNSLGFDILVNTLDGIKLKGDIKLGKAATFYLKDKEKSLAEGKVLLDSTNFMKLSHQVNEEELKAFLDAAESKFTTNSESIRANIYNKFDQIKKAVDEKIDLSKHSLPDVRIFVSSYENSLIEITKELEVDPSFKQISEAYKNLSQKLVQIVNDLDNLSRETLQSFKTAFDSVREKVSDIYKETILPSLEEISKNLIELCGKLQVWILETMKIQLKASLDLIEKYVPIISQYAKALNEALKPLNDIISEVSKFLTAAYEQIEEDLKIYFDKLPSLAELETEIKEKITAMNLPEKLIEFVENLFDKLSIVPVNPETKQFLEKLQNFIVMKLKGQPVDDEQYGKDIFNYLIIAIRSIISSIEISLPNVSTVISSEGVNSFTTMLYSTLDVFGKLPTLLSFRFSVSNYILNENWYHILLMNWSKPWILFRDFDLNGHVIDGKHIFTFDGNYLTFVGSCKYILAQDTVDNNFTLIAQVMNGKLKSITLTDRDNHFMELLDTGALKENGNLVEFPYHQNGMHSWRRFYTTWLLSEYGVTIMCTSDLKVCHIQVNGFYTSKTRGLLGNGNIEQYDDFMQIDGKISNDVETFVNNYGIGKCSALAATAITDKHNDICSELFGYSSPLALGYYFIDSQPYRKACDQAVANSPEKDSEAAACSIAFAYGSALKLQKKLIVLPPRCLKCTGAPSQRDLGQEFIVKIPTNKADVAFVVDFEITENILKHIVGPVIKDIRETLKSRGFNDVQIVLIAYTENQRYPAIITSDGGKINYNGNIADVKMNGPPKLNLDDVANYIKINDIIDHIEEIAKVMIPQGDELAYKLALDYPFRANAAKAVVAVRSDVMDNKNLLKGIRAHVVGSVRNYDSAILHLIGPIDNLSVEGIASEKLIGFNSRLIATVDGKDNKKRQKLKFSNNMGIDFVLNNNGWVFNTQHFEKMRPQDQKKVVTQISSSIADTLFKTEITAECACVPVHGIHAQHLCATKSSSFIPNKKPKSS